MIKSRKISILVLAVFFFIIMAGAGIAPARAAANLTDISDNWAYSKIADLLAKGVVGGYADGTFRPNNPISRAEFITLTNRAFGYNNTAAINYSDVKRGDWFYDEVAKAKAAGYIAGYPDGTMLPNSQISRQEVAVIVAHVLNLDTSSSGDLTFGDKTSIPGWSRNAIAAMVQGGYISGYPDGNMRPFNNITRAEAAVIISLSIGTRVAATGVTLDEPAAIVAAGDSIALRAAVAPNNATNQRVNWSSSDKTIAIVSATGKVTGLAAGKATITATTADGGYMDSCQVTVVTPIAVTGISLDQNSLTLTRGYGGTLAAKVEPKEATDQSVTWSSSDPRIVKVDGTGGVTAVAVGTATVTARTLDGGYNATCLVTVVAPVAVAGVSLNKSTTNITLGYSETLTAIITPKEAANQKVIWSSSDPAIATVSSTGQVTAIAAGSATIMAVTAEGGFTASCLVTVSVPINVAGVILDQSALALAVGQSATLAAMITPADATNQIVNWFSSDNLVATVSNGKVTAVGAGSATITVRTQDGGTTAACAVTVSAQ